MVSGVSNSSNVASLLQTGNTAASQGSSMSVTQRQQDSVEISSAAQKASEQTEKTTGQDTDGDGH